MTKAEVVSMSCRRLEKTNCPMEIQYGKAKNKQVDYCSRCIYYAPNQIIKKLPKVLPGQEKLL